jgi:hypothetical protein
VQALSLGALRNMTQLSALRGQLRHTLQALLLDSLPNLEDLSDVAACEALRQLGMYGCRPKDKSLQPLRQLDGQLSLRPLRLAACSCVGLLKMHIFP